MPTSIHKWRPGSRILRDNAGQKNLSGTRASYGAPSVPKGRRAEDGPIDNRYQLRKTPRADYLQRTEWNVRDSDGTVVFSIEPALTGGSKKTVELARKHGKPCLHLSAQGARDKAQEQLREFIGQHGIKVLNVAGPRASKEPAVGAFVVETLRLALLEAGSPQLP